MHINKKKLIQIIKEECAAVVADNDMPSSHGPMTISGHPDHEVKMASKQLGKTARYSQSLMAKMDKMGEQNLPAWVQAKITKASDYISMVYYYLEDDLEMEEITALEKVNEGWEMLGDPTTLALGAGGLLALYYMLFGKKADPEEDLNRVRDEIERKIIQADLGTGGRGTRPVEDAEERQIQRNAKLRRFKKQMAARRRIGSGDDV